jgi:Zn finger protein HypA/HybF involved in hydrogenase expression
MTKPRKKILVKEEIFVRECLKCGREFKAEGRFNRICNRCKSTEDWRNLKIQYELNHYYRP